jgi:hypothetical protein
MEITEHQRHELHKDLEQAIGSQSASTLMSYLPPVGWADVATKRDLESLQHRLEAKFFEELNSQTKTLVFAMSTMVLTVASLAFAAAHLI